MLVFLKVLLILPGLKVLHPDAFNKVRNLSFVVFLMPSLIIGLRAFA